MFPGKLFLPSDFATLPRRLPVLPGPHAPFPFSLSVFSMTRRLSAKLSRFVENSTSVCIFLALMLVLVDPTPFVSASKPWAWRRRNRRASRSSSLADILAAFSSSKALIGTRVQPFQFGFLGISGVAFVAVRDDGALVLAGFTALGVVDFAGSTELDAAGRVEAAFTALLTADLTDCGMLSLGFFVTTRTVSERACATLRLVP